MDSNIINIGDKIDVRVLHKVEQERKKGQMAKVYKSKVQDIKPDDLLEISMPMDRGKMVLLSTGIRYEFIFYTQKGLYRCVAQVKERYKVNNLYMLLIEPKSSLEKFQRREYFRFECAVDMEYMPITEEEAQIEEIEELKARHHESFPDEQMRLGIAVDLSGGGIRFVGEEEVEKGTYLLVRILLGVGENGKLLEIAAWVLSCTKVENNSDTKKNKKYEYRVQFSTEDQEKREMIIKYIFEQERKNRQKG